MGKAVMFMMFIFLVVTIAGNVMQGQVGYARTHLDSDITDLSNIIHVASTEGFPDVGIIDIGGERIAYSTMTATTFEGNPARPLVRGAQGTEAVAHNEGDQVATPEGAMMNTSMNYNLAVIADPTGMLAFVSVPVAVFALLGSFFFLPLQFLGTDLQILTVFWAVIGAGLLVALTVQLAGGRHV